LRHGAIARRPPPKPMRAEGPGRLLEGLGYRVGVGVRVELRLGLGLELGEAPGRRQLASPPPRAAACECSRDGVEGEGWLDGGGGGAGGEGGAVGGNREIATAPCSMPELDASDATLWRGASLDGLATFCDLLCAVVLGYLPEGNRGRPPRRRRGTPSEQARSPG
jgi:hypothetical protein